MKRATFYLAATNHAVATRHGVVFHLAIEVKHDRASKGSHLDFAQLLPLGDQWCGKSWYIQFFQLIETAEAMRLFLRKIVLYKLIAE
ncbi:hypothetical protein [Noviherbaspirillum saxi]|uniref:Uncharacterized protein n=1 Tax=Noviherbaspirillum saxi TaxID=2320863 RepID=A0A3A3FZA0_9BURK|nr:hypothetical protein [Noviherbaspirillum saxi]RJF99521.1 hypothetical protein D3871_14040 [Noviherbaspirillum saxi]